MAVYFIRAGDDGPVKIGHAKNPHRRLAYFQTGHYEELRIIRLIDGGQAEERWLHKYYSHLRLRNEWFAFSPSMHSVKVPASGAPCDLKAVRLARGESQAEFAEHFRVNQNTISRWESNGGPRRGYAQIVVNRFIAEHHAGTVQ